MRVSVAMCTYNGARYVLDQIDTILNQTLVPDEIVISDDASQDGTLEVIEEHLRELRHAGTIIPSFVILRNTTPLGVTANFAQAISATSGEVVFLCDQDDRWAPTKVQIMSTVFTSDHSVLLAFSDATLINGEGLQVAGSLFRRLTLSAQERVALRSRRAVPVLIKRNVVTGATVAFRRSLLEIALPFPESWVHDEWLSMLAALRDGLNLVDGALTEYRLHETNQIGARKRTLLYRVRRTFEPRSERNRRLQQRSNDLADALEDRNITPNSDYRHFVSRKARFDQVRLSLPASRLRRLPTIFTELRRGNYRHYSSQGTLDVLRDFMQSS